MSATLWHILAFGTLAGAAIPVGGWLAHIERLRPAWLETEFRHGVLAFGGGILISAVSLVLVPEGSRHLGVLPAVAAIAFGGVAFMALDRWLAARGNAVPQLIAMLADFLPEALALGAMYSASPRTAGLLAMLIAGQNLPEGFNAWRELAARGRSRPGPLVWLFVLVPLGPLCGLGGYFLLADHSGATGGLMLAAAGGILYITFQDLAPQARLERHWVPPLGAVLGFMVGLAGHMWLQGAP